MSILLYISKQLKKIFSDVTKDSVENKENNFLDD